MLEEEIRIDSAGTSLAGAFCRPAPDGRFPVVLMIHGSGPLDRNENFKGQRLDVFNALAHGLAAHGIASLRYDKHGCGASTGDYLHTGHEDLVADAVNCLDALCRIDGVAADKVFLLGHSEGSIIAPQVCLRRPHVAGMVLLCPFIEPMESVLIRQATQVRSELKQLPGFTGLLNRLMCRIFGDPLTWQQRLIRKLKSTSSPVFRSGLGKVPAKWFRELMAMDPAAIFTATTTPMFLIGGEKDMQCRPDDVFRIAEVCGAKSETWLVDNMNHVLRSDDGPPSITGSARLLGRPIEPALVDRIARWIQA